MAITLLCSLSVGFVFLLCVYLIGIQCAVVLLVPIKVRVRGDWLLADWLVKHGTLKLLHIEREIIKMGPSRTILCNLLGNN